MKKSAAGDSQLPKVPRHLRPETASWWSSVVAEWELEEHHIRLLTSACEAWDRAVQAREVLGRTGLTYKDRFGQPHARPEVTIERDSRVAFARLLRELALDVDEPMAPRPRTIGRRR